VGIAGLHVPLTSCIDFAGFRLGAMCELPISSRSLAVGTADGGATLVASDPRLLLQLRAAARVLNLKDHPVGRLTLSSAADLEGHLSPLDQRRYLVDFSRVMPPHPAATKPGAGEARFVALLRPELVQQSSEPLNPDVGSGFRRAGTTVDDPDDLRGLSVAGEMLNKFCLAVAKELSAQAAAAAATPQGLSGLPEQLSRLFHSHGVNMRMLGVVLVHVTHPAARRVLLVEMGARVIKVGIKFPFFILFSQFIQADHACAMARGDGVGRLRHVGSAAARRRRVLHRRVLLGHLLGRRSVSGNAESL
jgi:hypothetical protein